MYSMNFILPKGSCLDVFLDVVLGALFQLLLNDVGCGDRQIHRL